VAPLGVHGDTPEGMYCGALHPRPLAVPVHGIARECRACKDKRVELTVLEVSDDVVAYITDSKEIREDR